MAAKISLPRPVDVSPRRELQPEREREGEDKFSSLALN